MPRCVYFKATLVPMVGHRHCGVEQRRLLRHGQALPMGSVTRTRTAYTPRGTF